MPPGEAARRPLPPPAGSTLPRSSDAAGRRVGYTTSMAVPADPYGRPERAVDRLYRRHAGAVYRYALTVLANPADAEDVTQTTFLNAFRAYQAGQRPERPLHWLIAIAHNVCRQRFRDASRRPREVALVHDLRADDRDDGFSPGEIRRALAQLSFAQRSALALRELEGRSYREIAELLGLTEAAVETLIFRARRAFREQLEGALSCAEAERAISRQVDGELPRRERAELRAHLRACGDCASLARSLRAQRSALRGIAFVPLPPSLAGLPLPDGASLAGTAALGTGLGIKAAAVGVAALVAAGVGTEVARQRPAAPPRAVTSAAPRAQPTAARLAARTTPLRTERPVTATRPATPSVLMPTRRRTTARPAVRAASSAPAEVRTASAARDPAPPAENRSDALAASELAAVEPVAVDPAGHGRGGGGGTSSGRDRVTGDSNGNGNGDRSAGGTANGKAKVERSPGRAAASGAAGGSGSPKNDVKAKAMPEQSRAVEARARQEEAEEEAPSLGAPAEAEAATTTEEAPQPAADAPGQNGGGPPPDGKPGKGGPPGASGHGRD